MDVSSLLETEEGEKPLDRLVVGGGFCGIFRTEEFDDKYRIKFNEKTKELNV